MKSKVYIFGDSWGVGEWCNHQISHKGLEFFFNNIGYEVFNFSKPSGSNSDSVNRLSKIANNISPFDYIFFITTDASRDIHYKNKNQLTSIVIKNSSLPSLIDNLLEATYNNLNNICSKNNLKIHMIGGLNNLDLSVIAKYKNLAATIPSWVDLLVGHFLEYKEISNGNKFRILSNPNFIIDNIDLGKLDSKFAAQLIEDFYLYQEKNSIVFREEIFYPDGVHPNSTGHKILFELLVKKLNL
jgi:hypothetical protein